MPFDEAYLILALNPGALREEMLAAHRALTKRFHPIRAVPAISPPEAKDVLLQHIKA